MPFSFFATFFKPFIKDVFIAVTTDGVKGLFALKKRRKEEKRAQEQFERIKHIETLASRFAFDPSQKIRDLADTLSPLIADLHVRSCHNALDRLRQEVPADDLRALSRIDYYMGCCSRYISLEQSDAEFERAHAEMIGAKVYDHDIVASSIFLLCKKKSEESALQTAEILKGHDRSNIWAWVPSLIFADNLSEAYQSLPSDIDAFTVLCNACRLGTKDESFGVDPNTYKVEIPTDISYENISEWLFDLSLLMTRYVNEWNMTAFLPKDTAGNACRAFNTAVRSFREMLAKTQLGDLLKEIELWYLLSQYQITHDPTLLDSIKACPCAPKFKTHRTIAYAIFLSKATRWEEAKEYLVDQEMRNDLSVLNCRLLLALQTADADYATATLKDATDNKVVFTIPHNYYLLVSAKAFPEQVKPFVNKFVFPNGDDGKASQLILSHLTGEEIDETFLFKNRGNFNIVVEPFVVLVLYEKGYEEEAISLCEQIIPQGVVDRRTFIYIDILERSPKHADKLYKMLGDLRRGGYTENMHYLTKEYNLACQVKDADSMLEITSLLYSKQPDNASFFVRYMVVATTCQKLEIVRKLMCEISKYQFDELEADQLFNALIFSKEYSVALEFLYGYINSHPASEKLNMLFQESAINPYTSAIVNKEYDVVFDGAYVHFLHNGETQSAEITSSTRLKILIGKSKGDVVEDVDRMNRRDVYEILSIHNCYRQLIEEIYKDIGEGNYDRAVSYQFTEEEMKNGDIFEVLNRMVGHDGDWFRQHNDNLQKYKQGEMPLGNFVNLRDLIASLYEHLFGRFKVYNMSHQNFDELYKLRSVDVDKMDYVLDISSLIMLFELHSKFNLVFKGKFIVSHGIIEIIKTYLLKEQNGTPSFIPQNLGDFLSEVKALEGEHWMETRLRSLLSWIDRYAEVEMATELLNVDDKGVFNRSEYVALFYESMLLANRGERILMTMDQYFVRTFIGYVPMSDVNAFVNHFYPDKYTDICQFFIQTNIYGGEIDVRFAIDEYNKYALGQVSLFKNCQENLTLSRVSYIQVVDLCIAISQRSVLLEVDLLMIEALLHDMFVLFNQQEASLVLRFIFSKTHNPIVRERAQSAFVLAHPIYQ